MGDNRIGIFGVLIVCILFPFYPAADGIDEQYIGCYQDNITVRDLENEILLDSMTITSCIEHCINHNKTYAGAQNGSECFCGDTYGTYGQSRECTVNCPGNASYYCGGILQNSIYSVCPLSRYGISCNRECHCFKEAPCNLVNGSCPTGCATGWSGPMCDRTSVPAPELTHYGCFNDSRTNGFPVIYFDPQMTVQLCMDRCRTNFGLYAGLQYREHCCCGNSSYSINGPSDMCGRDCPVGCSCAGSAADRCGGPYANDVYPTCQDGYYGVLCSHQCHCFNGSNCTMEDGTCPPGGCSEGWMGTSCNIRNCADNNGNCAGENEACTYEHTGEGAERVVPRCRCREGYTRNQEYENCTDIDECSLIWPSNQCNFKFGDCVNLEGTYNCTCKTGFQNNGSTVCEDINECELFWPDNQCNSVFGECVNLEGTHDCKCKIGFHQNNGTIACEADESDNSVIVGAVVGSLCALLVILALLAFLYWRRRHIEKSSGSRRNSGFSNTWKEDDNGLTEIDLLWKIQTTKMREEFKTVPMEADYPTDYASSPELKEKNKYRNILPYNHNRVKLDVIGSDPFSDYINASFISNYRNMKVIASHGPQSRTVNDFWRMVWEQDVAVIVMITKCIENGRPKCEQYWPETTETRTFGLLEVINVKEESFADYAIRRIKLSLGTESRFVCQCHFMAWPDHDVPTHALTLLKFRRSILKYMQEDKGVVIHCSAGVGRTGTYIAIDNLLCEAEDSSRVNVLQCLLNLRQQRMHMIQTEGQYVFVYLAIVEAYMAGKTTSTCSDFTRKFASKENLRATIEKEYQALEKMKSYLTDDDKHDALLPINLQKNREIDKMPASRNRVFILTREKDRNDYINAVFCQSFHFKESFIQTQLPLPETVVDFWNMCLDYNCQFVVVLDENNHPDFIPTPKEPLAFQHLTVHYKAERTIMGGKVFDLSVAAKRNLQKSDPEADESIYMNVDTGNAVTVAIISTMKNGLFDNEHILSLYNIMRATYSPEQQSKIPIVVMCRNGCTHSSIFICMSNLADMIESQKEVNVFEAVYDIRMTRPQAVESLFLYEQLYSVTLLKLKGSREETARVGSDKELDIYVNS